MQKASTFLLKTFFATNSIDNSMNRLWLTGEKGAAAVSKKPLHYKGCVFHRVIPDFMLQVR
jgi:cyclophilin family peptidyl-prolyl cis-trans isomerase